MSDRDYAAEIRDIAARSAQVETEQLREWAAEIERLGLDLKHARRQYELAVATDVRDALARAERAESALAASESRAAGLATALLRAHDRLVSAPAHDTDEVIDIREDMRGAIAASGLGCVRGWWQRIGDDGSKGFACIKLNHDAIPAAVVYSKEQQHGA